MNCIDYLARLMKLLRSPFPTRTEQPARLPRELARIMEPARRLEEPRHS
jgi:hypothetical protein